MINEYGMIKKTSDTNLSMELYEKALGSGSIGYVKRAVAAFNEHITGVANIFRPNFVRAADIISLQDRIAEWMDGYQDEKTRRELAEIRRNISL